MTTQIRPLYPAKMLPAVHAQLCG
ncbi:hypothetical protein YPPY72_0745, partial [Yersinia pestis PY-72]